MMNESASSNRPPAPLGKLPPTSPPPLFLPARSPNAHKGSFGRVLLIGGSRGMAGAISLAAMSALRCGSGLVTAAVPDRILETVASFHPCVMTMPLADTTPGVFDPQAANQLKPKFASFDAIAIGPGMGTFAGAQHLLDAILHVPTPKVIDADGLNILALEKSRLGKLTGPCVLTPHPGEWERISGIAAHDRKEQCQSAIRFANESGCTILLKGAQTFVTDGEQTYFNSTGNPGMATGGSGDCLTGVIAALLGLGLTPWNASILGAWIHGCAGDLAASRYGMAGMTPCELIQELPFAIDHATQGVQT